MKKRGPNEARTERRVNAELVAQGKCGRKNRSRQRKSEWCTKTAGWGTDHVGSGACTIHGGSNPIGHGRFSEVAREKLGDRHERWLSDPKLASIDGEVALLRGLMERLVEGEAKPEEVADMAERVVRAVDVLLKHREKFGLTMETFNRVTAAMGVSVAKHVTSPEILERIQREWDEIRLT